MGGAYTAKAETESEAADVPSGWNKNWGYPGPDPPGYDPDEDEAYVLTLQAGWPGYLTPESPYCYVTALLFEDQGTFGSVNIENDSFITWFVAIDGELRPVSVDGGAYEYNPSSLIAYQFGQTTHGANPLMRFWITEDDDGKEAVVDAIATVRRLGEPDWQFTSVLAVAPISIPIGCSNDPDLEYQQNVRGDFALLKEYCIDYVTAGMRVFVEATETGEGGWSNYVGTTLAEECEIRRFWAWTQYPEMGVWEGTTVGIIDRRGVIQTPFAGYTGGAWTETPITGEDTENWWLIQLTQEERSEGEESTVTKPITGTFHWMAYTIETQCHCIAEKDESSCFIFTVTLTTIDSCKETTDIDILVLGPTCPPLQPPYCCESEEGESEGSGTIEYEAEDDPISLGEDFFKTWYYYDNLS